MGAKTLGAASALMIVLGYPGELMLSNLGTRWLFWAAAMVPFLYIVKTLLVGLIEIILVMKLPADEMASQAKTLGAASALMIVLGYPGELMLSNLGTRWLFWAAAMVPF